MNRKIVALFCLSLIIILSGCASKKDVDQDLEQQTEKEAQTYTISSHADEDIDALNDTANQAVKFCRSKGKHKKPAIIDRKTKYLGLDDEQKKLVIKANQTFAENNNTFSKRDYKVTITFLCITEEPKTKRR